MPAKVIIIVLFLYFRELPFPLLTYEYQPTFASVEGVFISLITFSRLTFLELRSRADQQWFIVLMFFIEIPDRVQQLQALNLLVLLLPVAHRDTLRVSIAEFDGLANLPRKVTFIEYMCQGDVTAL
jgi:hypothetical protein